MPPTRTRSTPHTPARIHHPVHDTHPTRRPRTRPHTLALLAAALAPTLACGSAPAALGATIPAARVNATEMLTALAERFGPVARTPALVASRARYATSPLVPSRFYGDTTVFTSIEGATHTIAVAGAPAKSGRFLLALTPHAPPPAAPGHSRHVMHLRHLGGDEFAWDSSDELAIGRTRPHAFAQAIVRAVSSLELGNDAGVRLLYRTGLPHTTTALGRLFSADSVRTTPLGDGTTAVTLGIGFYPARIRGEMPHFAAYLDKYVQPARYHFTLTDRENTPWLDVAQSQNLLAIRMRTRGGVLQPLTGPPRPLPDTLSIRLGIQVKVRFFTVGLSDLVGDFVFVDSKDERGWATHFTHDPDWHLPPVVGRLLRTTLKRPFAGEGVGLRFAVRDGAAGQSYLTRDIHVVVQESALGRWLGGLGNKASGDVTSAVEEERDQFISDAFRALSTDLQ